MEHLRHELRVNTLALFSNPHEIANSVTHGLGTALSAIGALVMMATVWEGGDIWRNIGCNVFMLSMMAVNAASTLSHAVQTRRLKRLFRIWDQALIYLLIVGTYTPFALVYLRSGWWWLLHGAMWGLAATGFVSKLFFHHRIQGICVWLYLGLGWLPVIALPTLFAVAPPTGTWWMIQGGLSYTLGTIFLMTDRKDLFFHAIWHLLVMLGSFCHFIGVFYYVAPIH